MLENNSSAGRGDNQMRVLHRTNSEPIVFAEENIITSPPDIHSAGLQIFETRRPLPISTIQFGDPRIPGHNTAIPRSGLDFLYGIASIHIEQSLDLNHSENKFIVRSSTNDAIYSATESSTGRNRLLYGANRPFYMYLLDKSHQESLSFRRKLRLGYCLFQPQCLEVWTPPGDFVGLVKEKSSLFGIEFSVENRNGDVVAYIVGPSKVLCACNPNEMVLKVLSSDYTTQLGTITRIWNTDISMYTHNVYYADPCMDVKVKALFMGAAFLVEYMFFQSTFF